MCRHTNKTHLGRLTHTHTCADTQIKQHKHREGQTIQEKIIKNKKFELAVCADRRRPAGNQGIGQRKYIF